MRELLESVNPAAEAEPSHVPTIYFIDDSATMREVIKIAFRRENIQVITCPDASTALAQFDKTPPDAVITDVIMPDKNGYEVCQHIKQDPRFEKTPVILMSGVVNKTVAERAISVRADELIRKPFQPQELVSRVRGLLHSKTEQRPETGEPRSSTKPLQTIFAPPPDAPGPSAAWPKALAKALAPQPHPLAHMPAEVQKLRNEIIRLELLVKKLQTELTIEKEYCESLDRHFRKLQESS